MKTPAGQPLKGEQLTKEQFDRLPDSQALDVKGRRMTAGEIRAGMKQARAQVEAKAAAAAARVQAEFEADRAKFLNAEKAQLRTAGRRPAAPAQAQQLDAVRREANQLVERVRTASPAEQAQIEERAAQLLKQLSRR